MTWVQGRHFLEMFWEWLTYSSIFLFRDKKERIIGGSPLYLSKETVSCLYSLSHPNKNTIFVNLLNKKRVLVNFRRIRNYFTFPFWPEKFNYSLWKEGGFPIWLIRKRLKRVTSKVWRSIRPRDKVTEDVSMRLLFTKDTCTNCCLCS